MDGRKFQIGNVSSFIVKKGYFHLYVDDNKFPLFLDDNKLTGKKQNIDTMWKVTNNEIDLGEPTSSFDHVYLVCT